MNTAVTLPLHDRASRWLRPRITPNMAAQSSFAPMIGQPRPITPEGFSLGRQNAGAPGFPFG